VQPWRIFSLFLLLLSCSTLIYFGVRFGRELWVYSSLTGKSAAKVTRWDIEEEGSRYAIWAVYEYESKEKILINRARFPGPLFLNEEAAEKELRAKSKQSITAYYDPSNPTRSALGRAFPTSYGIRCIISFLILVYFFSFKKKLKSIFNQ
jgi:hypothetical protein